MGRAGASVEQVSYRCDVICSLESCACKVDGIARAGCDITHTHRIRALCENPSVTSLTGFLAAFDSTVTHPLAAQACDSSYYRRPRLVLIWSLIVCGYTQIQDRRSKIIKETTVTLASFAKSASAMSLKYVLSHDADTQCMMQSA